jgi:glucosylceramidase
MAFVRDYMRPLLRQHNLKTKIWLMDHNYIMWHRAKWMLDDPGVREASDGVAFHHYEGKPEMMSLLHDAHPQADLFYTEGGPAIDQPDYATNWCYWSRGITGAMNNWCRCYTGWNLVLDEKGKPNIGHFNCGGMITIHSETHALTYSGQYWGMKHFSHFVRRGARRIASEGTAEKLQHIAFINPDARRVLVLTNSGAAQTIALECGGRSAKVDLPADSVTTVEWDG